LPPVSPCSSPSGAVPDVARAVARRAHGGRRPHSVDVYGARSKMVDRTACSAFRQSSGSFATEAPAVASGGTPPAARGSKHDGSRPEGAGAVRHLAVHPLMLQRTFSLATRGRFPHAESSSPGSLGGEPSTSSRRSSLGSINPPVVQPSSVTSRATRPPRPQWADEVVEPAPNGKITSSMCCLRRSTSDLQVSAVEEAKFFSTSSEPSRSREASSGPTKGATPRPAARSILRAAAGQRSASGTHERSASREKRVSFAKDVKAPPPTSMLSLLAQCRTNSGECTPISRSPVPPAQPPPASVRRRPSHPGGEVFSRRLIEAAACG